MILENIYATKPRVSKAPRGFSKPGECARSRVNWTMRRFEIQAGVHVCECGAQLNLRFLAPGMKGEPRVSNIVPAHKAGVSTIDHSKISQ